MEHAQRKQEHLEICLNHDVSSSLTTGLRELRLCHSALPEINLADVDTRTTFLGRRLRAPLLISSMTGGTPESTQINRRLAEAAQSCGVAISLGSARIVLLDRAARPSFAVRSLAPDVLLLANLGAVQLNKGVSTDDCRRLVETLEADGLMLHLNPLQEALQPNGDTDFAGLLERIGRLCQVAEFPILIKEVGWGLTDSVARALAAVGVSALDVAGAGGTSWSEVEKHRSPEAEIAMVAEAFRDWGLTTVESLLACRAACPSLPLIASGGLQTGVDAAKCLALGANLVGYAAALLPAANESTTAVVTKLDIIQRQLQLAMFSTGVSRVADLGRQHVFAGSGDCV